MNLTPGMVASILGAGMNAVDNMPTAPHTLALGRMLDAMQQRASEFEDKAAVAAGVHPDDVAEWWRQAGRRIGSRVAAQIRPSGPTPLVVRGDSVEAFAANTIEILRYVDGGCAVMLAHLIKELGADEVVRRTLADMDPDARIHVTRRGHGDESDPDQESPCPARNREMPHDRHRFQVVCPGYSEPEENEPQPPDDEATVSCGDAAAGKEHGMHTWMTYDSRMHLCPGLPAGDG